MEEDGVPHASGVAVNMLFAHDAPFCDMLASFIDEEPVGSADPYLHGMMASMGIIKPAVQACPPRAGLEAGGVRRLGRAQPQLRGGRPRGECADARRFSRGRCRSSRSNSRNQHHSPALQHIAKGTPPSYPRRVKTAVKSLCVNPNVLAISSIGKSSTMQRVRPPHSRNSFRYERGNLNANVPLVSSTTCGMCCGAPTAASGRQTNSIISGVTPSGSCGRYMHQ
jgi:hypothetical protein